jgi:hypothetical protein
LRASGSILEPCAGDGVFVCALRGRGEVFWCETDPKRRRSNSRSFDDLTEHVDWIVTNPPWSQYRRFIAHALTVADSVAFTSTLNQSLDEVAARAGTPRRASVWSASPNLIARGSGGDRLSVGHRCC